MGLAFLSSLLGQNYELGGEEACLHIRVSMAEVFGAGWEPGQGLPGGSERRLTTMLAIGADPDSQSASSFKSLGGRVV